MKNYTAKKLYEFKNIHETGTAKLSQLTKGCFVKLKESSKTVYQFLGKDRSEGYILQNESNCEFRYIKKDLTIIVGFDY